MARLARGEMAPLGELYRRYGKMVETIVRRAGLDAEDLTHEVFITVAEGAKRYQDTGRLKAFLCGVAVRKCREARRNRYLRGLLLGRFRPESAVAPAGEARVEITQALAALSEDQREVLMLQWDPLESTCRHASLSIL